MIASAQVAHYARNAGKLFMPASNMKIVTGATSLTQLGPDYTFRTEFSAGGRVVHDTLQGALIVTGRGTPGNDQDSTTRRNFSATA